MVQPYLVAQVFAFDLPDQPGLRAPDRILTVDGAAWIQWTTNLNSLFERLDLPHDGRFAPIVAATRIDASIACLEHLVGVESVEFFSGYHCLHVAVLPDHPNTIDHAAKIIDLFWPKSQPSRIRTAA